NPCFLLTDHIPMPKNSISGLKRLGAEAISLGPRMLFASQCVVLIHNELDWRGGYPGLSQETRAASLIRRYLADRVALACTAAIITGAAMVILPGAAIGFAAKARGGVE